jgi:hypothetical protein
VIGDRWIDMICGNEDEEVGDVESDSGPPPLVVAGAVGAGRMLGSEACFFLSGFLRLLLEAEEEEGGGTATGPEPETAEPDEARVPEATLMLKACIWPERERGDV